MRTPGHLRRPQHLLPGPDARAWLHLLLHRTLITARSSSPAAPATSAATRPRRSPRAGRRVVVYDNLSAGHREAVRWVPIWSRPTCTTTDALPANGGADRRDAPSCTSPRWRRWASRCATRSATTANNVEGTLALLRAMLEDGVGRIVFSSTAAVFGEPSETPIAEAHRHAADQSVRRDQAGDRAGAAALRAGVRAAQHRAAVLQRGRGRSGRRASAKTTARRRT